MDGRYSSEGYETMGKIVLVFAALGFLVANGLGGMWWYVNSNQIGRVGWVISLDSVSTWLWPTSLTLMPSENSGAILLVALLLLSSLANAMVYSIVGLGVALIWKRLRAMITGAQS